jgi:FAD synthase
MPSALGRGPCRPARLRGNEKFDSVQALIAQMREDVDRARALTAG